MVQPHISLVDAIFMVPVQHLYGSFICLKIFLGEDDQAEQLPERFELFPSAHQPVRCGGSGDSDSHLTVFVDLPVQRHSVNVFVDGELGDDRFGRNAFFDYPVRQDADQDAFPVWSCILWAYIPFYIEKSGLNLQYLGHFFPDLCTARSGFGRLYDDLFSGQLFRQAHTAGSFGSFLRCRLLLLLHGAGQLFLYRLGDTELKQIHLAISGTAVAFLALKPKNILAEFIQLETQIGDHMVFFNNNPFFFSKNLFFFGQHQQGLFIQFFVVRLLVFHSLNIS